MFKARRQAPVGQQIDMFAYNFKNYMQINN